MLRVWKLKVEGGHTVMTSQDMAQKVIFHQFQELQTYLGATNSSNWEQLYVEKKKQCSCLDKWVGLSGSVYDGQVVGSVRNH